MNVLIIGGAGYIGSCQTRMMLDDGYNVTVFDNLSTGHLNMVDQRAKFIHGDIRDFTVIKETLLKNKIDIVMHFAALSIVSDSVKNPLDYYDNNVYGFQVLLKAMEEAKVDKIVFSSTAAVYGEHDKMPIDENYLTIPSSPYGETKLAMEKMIYWASKSFNLKYVVLRYFNVAGAHPSNEIGELHNPETHLIPLVLKVALNKMEKISIYGDDYNTDDGTCYRDYIHVVDLCQAHILAAEYLFNNKESNIFNLGYSHGFSVKQIIDSAKKVTKCNIPVVIDKRREGDPALLIASCDKVKSILKWQPKYDNIDLIIKTAYDFYVKQSNK